MIKRVDLNCDLGESYGMRSHNLDYKIMPYISSCNIACGFHSGDPLTLERTIDLAILNKVSIGAHPSFPDLQGFGRRQMDIEPIELKAIIKYQISALKGMVECKNAKLNHIKPHGALYNLAYKDKTVAQTICEAIVEIDNSLILYGLSNSLVAETAKAFNIQFCHEVFADRIYENDLSLRHRTKPDSVISEPENLVKQIDLFVRQESVLTYDNSLKQINVETICLHSDTNGAVNLAQNIYEFLIENQIQIEAPRKI